MQSWEDMINEIRDKSTEEVYGVPMINIQNVMDNIGATAAMGGGLPCGMSAVTSEDIKDCPKVGSYLYIDDDGFHHFVSKKPRNVRKDELNTITGYTKDSFGEVIMCVEGVLGNAWARWSDLKSTLILDNIAKHYNKKPSEIPHIGEVIEDLIVVGYKRCDKELHICFRDKVGSVIEISFDKLDYTGDER